jgi:hypothetical protein
MSSPQKQLLLLIGIALVLSGMAWIARPSNRTLNPSPLITPSLQTAAPLLTDAPLFDFGTISMADGIVRHLFTIKNNGDQPLTIVRIYTSCMCTKATLIVDGERFGPFGMPGHGPLPLINRRLDAGKEAKVEVIFDPAAHGPAGVGRIERAIYIETDSGLPLYPCYWRECRAIKNKI